MTSFDCAASADRCRREAFPLQQANEAMQEIRSGLLHGAAVLDLSFLADNRYCKVV